MEYYPFSKKTMNLLSGLKNFCKKKRPSPNERIELINNEELRSELIYFLENEIPKELTKESWPKKVKNFLVWLIPTATFLAISLPSDGIISYMMTREGWNNFFFYTLPLGVGGGTMAMKYGFGKKTIKKEDVVKDGMKTYTAIEFGQLLHDQAPFWWIAKDQMERYFRLWTNPDEIFMSYTGITGHEAFCDQWIHLILVYATLYGVTKIIDYSKRIKKEKRSALKSLLHNKEISLEELVEDFNSYKCKEELIHYKRAFENSFELASVTKTKKMVKHAIKDFKELSEYYRTFSKHVIKSHKKQIKEQIQFLLEEDKRIYKDDKATFVRYLGRDEKMAKKLYDFLYRKFGRWEKDKDYFAQKVCKRLNHNNINDIKQFLKEFYGGEELRTCLVRISRKLNLME